MRSMPEHLLSLGLTITLLIAALCAASRAEAVVYVKPGESIQAVIRTSSAGDIIMVSNGTYKERINITKSLSLIGDGGSVVDARGSGSAIILSADGISLEGFCAIRSGEEPRDAGIMVLSKNCTVRGNLVKRNGGHGILLYKTANNLVSGNMVSGNANDGISLERSFNNILDGNSIRGNRDGIHMEFSRANTVKSNEISGNLYGIYISNSNDSRSITYNGKGSKGVSIKYHPVEANSNHDVSKIDPSFSSNLIFKNNLTDNEENAYDNGFNHWDNGSVGNSYSDFNSRPQGCTDRNKDGICDSSYKVPGRSQEDHFPKASKDALLIYRSVGFKGWELRMFRFTFSPGESMSVDFTIPTNFSGWVSVIPAYADHWNAGKMSDTLSYKDMSGSCEGTLSFDAPADNGSYDLRMYDDTTHEVVTSLGFQVKPPSISASPSSVTIVDPIEVSYAGAPGYDADWIGMYSVGADDVRPISKQYLGGSENGVLEFVADNGGTYDFRMFQDGALTKVASSGPVNVKFMAGIKVVANPGHVEPGGLVTITYCGASAGSVIGMYGVARPDKFWIDMQPVGPQSCGRITFRVPTTPGTYDFRLFRDNINRQILGQSDAVTVGGGGNLLQSGNGLTPS
jgi:nitrous oxidase accessory protein